MNDNELKEKLQAMDANLIYLVQHIDQMAAKQSLIQNLMTVILKDGKLHEIGGYAYGRTSENSPFLILYSANKLLLHKICRVYQENFHLLPYYIPTKNIPNTATDGNPDRNAAQRQNNYHDCRHFTIATRPGKQTNMGNEVRFMMTVDALPTPAQVAPTPQPEEPDPATLAVLAVEEAKLQSEKDGDVAVDKLNDMLGLTKPEPLPKKTAPKPTTPYTYHDGTLVSDNAQVQAVFLAHYTAHRTAPHSKDVLKAWFERNEENVRTKYPEVFPSNTQ